MSLYDSFSISSSGMSAERLWLDIISNNIANLNTTRTAKGGPYKRQMPVFSQRLQSVVDSAKTRAGGVEVNRVVQDNAPPRMVYDPSHPDADQEGNVAYPNINIVNEMVNMMAARRAYEANATALEASKSMAMKALEIGRG
ncbi:flagellar basal-body rod protein FlgC [Desulfofarcimen acetoxidans DSM 771]|uniref:Flagellar basal-body rod protein FlgC n=1 Tax=Desulfofarcimen acetoxidans (strain ATCC 49208 / DSM 771 / KCTC 5769 / VKM B-1644 / 5575) TaxID=485916 RepID=C8W1F5_DESAS|nr:flagellar basal body rod protein FlgC [Desulfofarcimen acetoxidans]ACV61600.1 flagellar basal-body rod protein FlgC [Desulfofarcimen acetoxidans DSM 771]